MRWQLPRFPANDADAIRRYWRSMAAIPADQPGADILREMALNRLEELRREDARGVSRRVRWV